MFSSEAKFDLYRLSGGRSTGPKVLPGNVLVAAILIIMMMMMMTMMMMMMMMMMVTM